jgi:hypothetical protein
LEHVAIVYVLKMWRNYLMGNKFELRKYHNGRKYLFKKQNWNFKKTRCLEFLSEYDFHTKHIKWKENKVVDALNGKVHAMNYTTISMYNSYLKNIILYVVSVDEDYLHVQDGLQ